MLLILAACASTHPADAEVSAAPAEGGVRVRFRRLDGESADRPPELRAEGGLLEEVVFSPDLKAVSARWRRPKGRVTCRFPYDGVAVFEAEAPADPATVEYVFLEAEGARVTALLPRGCLLLPALPLRLPAAARLLLPNGIEIPAGEDGTVMLPLPRDTSGVLRRGDLPLLLETARGPIEFLVGIDADGTPAAISGYVHSPGSEALSGR